jgi:hypothetical protein
VAFWDEVHDEGLRFERHERELLAEACRTVDELRRLGEVLAAEGYSTHTGAGGAKLHPAVAERRQQRIALGRLLTALRIPDDNDDRSQYRGDARVLLAPAPAPGAA